MADETVALDGKWPCCEHCRHAVHARRDGHFNACKWCQLPDGVSDPDLAVSDPNLHAACYRSLEQARADYVKAVRAVREQAGMDAAIGLSVRMMLGNVRWKTIRREKLQAIVDLHMGVPDGVDR